MSARPEPATLLITGGAGYIGAHTCVALQRAGYRLVVLDNFCNSSPQALARIERITGQPRRGPRRGARACRKKGSCLRFQGSGGRRGLGSSGLRLRLRLGRLGLRQQVGEFVKT